MGEGTATQGPSGNAGWRPALAGELDGLGRWLEGRLVLEPDPSAEVVPAERFLDLEYLRSVVIRLGASGLAHWGNAVPPKPVADGDEQDDGDEEDDQDGEENVDLRLAVSRFSRHYTASLTAAAQVALARGVGLDLSPEHCQLVFWRDLPFRLVLTLDDAAVVTCDARPAAWPVQGRSVGSVEELREHVWRSLYAEHLAPLFERVRQLTRITRGLMWTNAAEWVGMVSDGAEEYLGPAAARPFVADRMALLEAPTLPGIEGPNPLLDRLHWIPSGETDFPQAVQTRQLCCSTYLLTDRGGRLCQNCPFLPLDDRVALIRERHGVSMGQPGGPAEQRSIELGRRRMKSPT